MRQFCFFLWLLPCLALAARADDLSKLARGQRILASRTAGIWGLLSVSDGESGGQILACKLDGRWREITGGGGAMGGGEFYEYGIPRQMWAKLAGRPISDWELEDVKERIHSEMTSRDDSQTLLKQSDLEHASAWGLTIWRNSFYARHGYVFRDPMLVQYFSSRPWYHPNPRFQPNSLSPTEVKNVQLIQRYQDQHGLNF